MRNPHNVLSRWFPGLACGVLLVGGSTAAVGQTVVQTFELVDVMLRPGLVPPYGAPQQMFGTFEWTYEVGDFENGTGEFLSIGIPWYSRGIQNLNITTETTSIECTLAGNYHDLGVDVSIFLLDSISPDRPALVDASRSKFSIEPGVTIRGTIISGSVVPVPSECTADISGSTDPNNPAFGVPNGILDATDFFYFLDRFAVGDLAVADLTGSSDPNAPGFGVPDGTLDASDFFFYLGLFAQGCS